MPIPTRSISIGRSRQQPANVGSPAISQASSVSTTTTDEILSFNAPGNDRTSSRNRSLLPVHDSRLTGPQLQQETSSRLSQRATKHLQKGQSQPGHEPTQAPSREPTLLNRRQSLIRPGQLKTQSSTKHTTILTTGKRDVVGRGPPSPLKQTGPTKQNGRPLSPKKTDMAPPLRPSRSASLRQPASSSAGSPGIPRGHARHRSQVLTPASSHAPKKTDPPQAQIAAPTSRLRNQFTTFQQQFSPKKTIKSQGADVPVRIPGDQDTSLIPSSWPEIVALQTEVLQTCLLHTLTLQQHLEWEAGAESQLRRKYESVAGGYMAILNVEKESQNQLNAQALHSWFKNSREHNGQQGFVEQIQLLSQVTQEVYDLNNSLGGRYAMVVKDFETWLHEVDIIRNSRLRPVGKPELMVFVDPLGHGWKDEVQSLIMKLDLSLRQVQGLDILGYGEVESLDGSALLRTARGLDEMIQLMLEELSAMYKIETDLVKSERAWVSQLAQELTATQSQDERVPKIGMWRRPPLKS